ncbi:uncharacterized protein LOC114378696 [Glycine soja]|uniref:uncharacterized protein LOC114378696 n=1 Tax=Glycine soja TaxID=3848 RepID=UPI00103E0691|nr:uncharacterized protein LOC114378696 [Glycine soja]
MKQKFQGSTRVKRAQLQALRKDFEILQMKEGETVNAYFSRTLTIANKMKAHGESMSETVITAKILRSMISKFDYVVCSIEESNNLDMMTIDELQSSLLVHEQRMRSRGEEEKVLKISHEDKASRGRGKGREKEKDEELLLMSYVELGQDKMEEVWFLDSGCSNHMTGNKE